MTIFTHCHSNTVIDVLKKAKSQRKRFSVNNTETRPLFQGRITAKQLSRLNIKVTHFVDSAARLAIKDSNIMLIGCDAITSEGKVINKIGSEMFSEIASKHETSVYVCTHSWKFDPKTIFGFETIIEKRNAKEIWPRPPKKVKISNYTFEKINPDLITGIISELGIHPPEVFLQEVKKVYPWMLK
jgi:ribose 1,5-bisphosphate isomerase